MLKSKILFNFYRFLSHITFGKLQRYFVAKKLSFTNPHTQAQKTLSQLVKNDLEQHNIFIVNNGKNNKINISKDYSGFTGKIIINVSGNNNVIDIPFLKNIKGILTIICPGDFNVMQMKNIYVGGYLKIMFGKKHKSGVIPNKMRVVFGENFCTEGTEIVLQHSNTGVCIGNNSMFSAGIYISNSDHHPIYDMNTKKLINGNVKDIVIGNNVWVGRNVTILKNVEIVDGCIIGMGAVVSKKCDVSNGVYVGNPAVCKKKNVFWKQEDDDFVRNIYI